MSTPTLATAGGRQFDEGYAGQIADLNEAQVISKTNTSATAVDFGVVVARDNTSPNGVKPWAADGDAIAGVSVRNPLFAADASGVVKYAQYASLPVIIDGVVMVQVAEDVREGDQALIITAGGSGNATAGALGGSKGGVAGSGRVDYPGAVFEEDILSGKVGRLRVKSTGTRRTTT